MTHSYLRKQCRVQYVLLRSGKRPRLAGYREYKNSSIDLYYEYLQPGEYFYRLEVNGRVWRGTAKIKTRV